MITVETATELRALLKRYLDAQAKSTAAQDARARLQAGTTRARLESAAEAMISEDDFATSSDRIAGPTLPAALAGFMDGALTVALVCIEPIAMPGYVISGRGGGT